MPQGVILAAGASTRTLPLTATRPKPLLPLLLEPLLERQLQQLVGLVEEVILVVGYRSDMIRDHFGDRWSGIPIRYVEQGAPRGTAHALAQTAPYLQGRFLLLNGDDLYHADDLRALLQHPAAILVTRAPDPENRAVVSVVDGAVAEIIEKPASPPRDALCSVGGYVFDTDALGLLGEVPESPRGELELPDLVRLLIHRRPVRVSPVAKLWLPLTYPWDLLSVTIDLLSRPDRAALLGIESPSAPTPEGVIEGPVLLGKDVRIGKDCLIRGPAVVGDSSEIDEGARIEESVLLPDVRVRAGARVSHSVLGESVEIGPDASIESESASGEPVPMQVKGKWVTSGLRRLGLIAGDGARVLPGATVPAGTMLAPGESRPRNASSGL